MSIRTKQTAGALGRFDLSIHIKRSHQWHDELVVQALMVSFSVIRNEESSNSFARRDLAKEKLLVKAFGFKSTEKSLQVRVQVRASFGLVVQPARLTPACRCRLNAVGLEDVAYRHRC